VSFRCAVTNQTHQSSLAANVVKCLMTSSLVCNAITSNDSDNEIWGVTIKHVENVVKTDHSGLFKCF